MVTSNPYRRTAYSPLDPNALKDQNLYAEENEQQVVFSGADLIAFVNHIKVGNLETITVQTSREVVGNYVMGKADAIQITKGKRVIVGSLMFAQYDKHALLEQVFRMSKSGIKTYGDLWDTRGTANRLRNLEPLSQETRTSKGAGGRTQTGDGYAEPAYDMDGIARGLSWTEYQLQLDDQARIAADLVGATKVNYADQIPPFDLTLVGVAPNGRAARCTVFGIDITQETGGWSMQDLGNSVGFSFTARAINPWRAVEFDSTLQGVIQTATGALLGR